MFRPKTMLGLLLVFLMTTGQPTAAATLAIRGTLVAGPPWRSGAWIGGDSSAAAIEAFAMWRGSDAETVTTYPAYETWAEIAESDWHVSTFEGFEGRLVYGLPLLPKTGGSTLAGVAAGNHDYAWRSVARTLVEHGRGDSFVRIGLEANGTWFPWGATADTADDFVAAYRHVAMQMEAVAPDLRLVFDITCGAPLEGSDHRLASLNRLYPGDDVVDVVGCDFYDAWTTKVRSEAELDQALTPRLGAGLTDVAAFAEDHGKRFAVPEWGLTTVDANGSGDNPYFIRAMYHFFLKHRDSLAFENYFDEPHDYLRSSLYRQGQNPAAGAEYRRLW